VALISRCPSSSVFLTLLRITTPKFLISQSRYAILIITIIAAVVTPTPDVFNMMLFAVPMVIAILCGYIRQLCADVEPRREEAAVA